MGKRNNLNFKSLSRAMKVPTSTNRERINYYAYGKQLTQSHYLRLMAQKEVYNHPTLPIAVVKTTYRQKIKIIDKIRAVELTEYYEKDSPYPKVMIDGVSKSIHRLVVEAYSGELIKENQNVHHCDNNKDNYDFNNLIILNKKLHEELHRTNIK